MKATDRQLSAEAGVSSQPLADDRLPQDQVDGAAFTASDEDAALWRDRALRLQAEMENYRKRQMRRAEARIEEEREQLLAAFLGIADDLERALQAGDARVADLRRGVALTHQALLHLLEREGVQPIEAKGGPFDPVWHEAVDSVPHRQVGVAPDTVVAVVQQGYRLDDRVLRPARVVVAT